MLHFLFTDPSNVSGQAFFDMMSDFVVRYSGKTASSDDFRLVANEHFGKTPIARKYGLQDLNWFFQQWVYGYQLPRYRLEYRVDRGQDGRFLVKGKVLQSGVPEHWFMPLPLMITYGKNQTGFGTVPAYGQSRAFEILLNREPKKVELDPGKWILADSIVSKRAG
jgi:aminopeptidase N